jgi:hypothetical protein
MPKEIEDRLKKEAEKKFPGDKERQDAYVYGTMNRIENHWYWRKRGKKGQ